MANLIFVNRYYAPDQSATAQLLTDLAEHLVGEGQRVSIVTSRLLYDSASASLPKHQLLNEVSIYRVWTSRFGRANLAGRAFDYLTFYLSASLRLLWLVKQGDTVIAKTDPPLISIFATLVCWLKGAKLINWLQDLFPEVAEVLGVRLAKGLPGNCLRWMRNVSLKFARTNVVLGELMKERLIANGIPEHQITVIHNWVVGNNIQSIPKDENQLIRDWGLEGKFVVGYSGNLGRAHNHLIMLAAIEKLRDNTDIVFLFIGGGTGLEILKQEVVSKQLPNVLFRPYQPLDTLGQSLSVADVHLITLQPSLEGLIVPSKFYGVMAVGRPICYIGHREGEIGRIVRLYEMGAVTETYDELVLALNEMQRNHSAHVKLIQHRYIEFFSPDHAQMLWRKLLL